MKTLIAAVLAVSALLLAPLPAHAKSDPKAVDRGCVNTYEWSRLQTELDSPDGSARRSVIESAWDVLPVGYRNQYWTPGNAALYSLAYEFCQNPQKLIVLVYRKASGSWQIALKGEFSPA